MANTGDTLVCQVGKNANFVGSHLWNTYEEDESHSASLYHIGRTKRFPRCVMIDSPDNLGQLSTEELPARGVADSIWGGSIQTAVNVRQTEDDGCVKKDPAYYSSYGSQFWTDFLKPELHSKSICELPKWTGGEYYDSFHKGLIGSSTNDTLSADYLESVMDTCRYFAEGCDHLTTIEILTEHVGGSAGLTTSLLQALREEFGNSVCVPVWSVSGRKSDLAVLNYDGATLLDSISTMKNKVSVLDSALFYHKATEYCNAMIPISLQEILSCIYDNASESTAEEDRQYNTYLSTAVAAAAISTATSYYTTPVHYSTDTTELMQGYASLDQRQQQRATFTTSSAAADAPQEVQIDNAHQWCAAATHRGRLPLCFLEAGFPGILKNREKLPSTVTYDGLQQYLIDAFDSKKYPNRAVKSSYLRTINPFAVALSPVPFAYRNHGQDEDGRQVVAKLKDFPYQRAFTNLLSVRGCSGDALREGLYTQCRSHPYRISSCQLNAAPLYVASSSPFHNDAEEDHVAEHAHNHLQNSSSNHNSNHVHQDDDNTYTNPYHTNDNPARDAAQSTSNGSCVELVTAVHASPLVGAYLSQQTSQWRAACSLQSVAVQLDKAGMDRTECREVEEQLQELAQRYEL